MAKPDQKLFDESETPPSLIGGKCEDCGYTFFPMQTFGCLRCGGQRLSEHRLRGAGKVVTKSTVHIHPDPARPTPFTIVAVVLDDGPAVRTLIDQEDANTVQIGDRVITSLVPESRPDRGEHDLRFSRVKETS